MKINGRKIEGANYEYIVIPRPGGDVVFKAQAVLTYEPFHAMCKEPKPGKIMVPGGVTKEDYDDEVYKAALRTYAERRYMYILLTSLQATDGLEWETVKYTDPETWQNWERELRDAGFTPGEINIIQLGVANANSLNQEKLDEARNRFLASLEAVTNAA